MKCTFGRSVDLESMETSRDTLKRIFGNERVEDDFHGVVEYIVKNPKEYRQKVEECYANENTENPEICKECGGACCLRAPCHWSPRDIEDLSYSGLKKLLEEKKYISILRFPGSVCDSCLRTVSCNNFYYYILRTRTRGTGIAAVARRIKADDHCILLKEDGCDISFKERPRGARLLIPEKDKRCRHLYDLDDCIYEWQDHQDVLRKLFHYFKIVEMPKAIIKK